ncbi:AbiV family abortive infection protein [Pseudomonas abietaniphila]|jgi:AbiV family abortive infection protein
MHKLSIQQLQPLRIAIFDNTTELCQEAELLARNEMYTRSYLLAHFCIEELGKLPFILSASWQLENNQTVDWKKNEKKV